MFEIISPQRKTSIFQPLTTQNSGKIMEEKSPTKKFEIRHTAHKHTHTHMVNNQISESFRINGDLMSSLS